MDGKLRPVYVLKVIAPGGRVIERDAGEIVWVNPEHVLRLVRTTEFAPSFYANLVMPDVRYVVYVGGLKDHYKCGDPLESLARWLEEGNYTLTENGNGTQESRW